MSRSSNAYCSALADWLTNALAPDNALDVGSGDCALLLALARRGISAHGLDGSATAVESAPEEVTVFLTRLDRPFLLNKMFPLVCCLEVAEHLPRRSGRTLISALARHARETILFSAAHPGQGGTGHINEQPREYWTALFAAQGWIEDRVQTDTVRRVLLEAEAPWYLSKNIMVMVKSGFDEDRGSHSIIQ
jgi:2-polyprenyl-3-methyl-5-hydroxy-6-metoxy-1,4-benzoquinol methylase